MKFSKYLENHLPIEVPMALLELQDASESLTTIWIKQSQRQNFHRLSKTSKSSSLLMMLLSSLINSIETKMEDLIMMSF